MISAKAGQRVLLDSDDIMQFFLVPIAREDTFMLLMGANKIRRFATPLWVALAAIGWGWALFLNMENDRLLPMKDQRSGVRTQRNASQRSAASSSLASRLPTNRSARLLAQIDQITAEARPGKINELLISACHETLLDSDHNRRLRDFTLLIDLLRPEDAAAMHEAFLALHREGRGFIPEYAAFATRWGEIDPVGALDHLAKEVPMRMPTHDFGNILRGWAQLDPQAALQWVKQHPDLAESKEGWSAVINGWMRYDSTAATEYLLKNNLPPNQVIQSVRYAAVEKQFSTGIEESASWIASLPDDGYFGAASRVAWAAAAFNLSELPYDTAANVWSQVGGEPWMRFEQFEHFSGMIANARVNDRGLDGFLEALQARWTDDRISGAFSNWMKIQPDRVANWLATVPEGPFKTAAMLGVTQSGLAPEE